jgi:pimeloyl-ACP methyl ester carboxylesterase
VKAVWVLTGSRRVVAPLVFVLCAGIRFTSAPLPAAASPHSDAQVGSAERSSAIHEVRIDVDGVEVRALCTDGRREVVLVPGEASSADAWRPVLERLDGVTGACAYDRLAGRDGGAAPERGWYELLDEMRRVHLALGFERDYVLVGQSLGGLYARLFAADRAGDIGGLVLVDPVHEDLPSRVQAGMPRDEWNDWVERLKRPNTDGVTESELGDRARTLRLPDVPVTILTATRRRDGGGWDARFLNEAARDVHASILQGITSARHIPAPGSGPDVHLDDPRLVADEIVRVVRMAG